MANKKSSNPNRNANWQIHAKKTDDDRKNPNKLFQKWHHMPRGIPCKILLLLIFVILHIDPLFCGHDVLVWYTRMPANGWWFFFALLCLFFYLQALLKSNPLIKFGKFVVIVLRIIGDYNFTVESVNWTELNWTERCDHTWNIKHIAITDEKFSVNFIRIILL